MLPRCSGLVILLLTVPIAPSSWQFWHHLAFCFLPIRWSHIIVLIYVAMITNDLNYLSMWLLDIECWVNFFLPFEKLIYIIGQNIDIFIQVLTYPVLDSGETKVIKLSLCLCATHYFGKGWAGQGWGEMWAISLGDCDIPSDRGKPRLWWWHRQGI